jgi:hypothetical protein
LGNAASGHSAFCARSTGSKRELGAFTPWWRPGRAREKQATQSQTQGTGGPGLGKTQVARRVIANWRLIQREIDPPPLKWSDLRYVFDIKEDCNGKEAIQA